MRQAEPRRSTWAGICRRVLTVALLASVVGCSGGSTEGNPIRFTIPQGSGFNSVTDTLTARGLVRWPLAFRLYARYKGAERSVKPGVYEVEPGIAWGSLLDKMVRGDVVRMTIVVPEGWTLAQIAPRIAQSTGADPDSVLAMLLDSTAPERYGVPGPTLEGYLYPATYIMPLGSSVDGVIGAMVARYKEVWTPERQALADSLGMDEREVVTLASIVEKEARSWGERDTIAAVFHNRLRIGMPLQADPTVQYARGSHETRLLYEHIEEVADNPYNTYRHRGLPPGPIASPSSGAIDAVLRPADVDFLYFVARPNGTHIFTRSLTEHNNARRLVERMRAEAAAAANQ